MDKVKKIQQEEQRFLTFCVKTNVDLEPWDVTRVLGQWGHALEGMSSCSSVFVFRFTS